MKYKIAGIYFDNLTMDEAVLAIVEMVTNGNGPHQVCTANLDHLESLRRDRDFLAVYKSADLILADGMPIVWLSHAGPAPLKERVAGSDLLYSLSSKSAELGLRMFFLGGKPDAAARSAEILVERYPGLKVVGTYCPAKELLNTPDEEKHIQAMIDEARPDILLVGFGAPKQEKWIAAHRDRLKVPVSIGVGATFDMAAGMVRRAPRWMQHAGLEWAFRLIQEPRRLYGRYLVKDLPFLVHLVLDLLHERKALDPSRATSKTNLPL